jgi:hypothetical protein
LAAAAALTGCYRYYIVPINNEGSNNTVTINVQADVPKQVDVGVESEVGGSLL